MMREVLIAPMQEYAKGRHYASESSYGVALTSEI